MKAVLQIPKFIYVGRQAIKFTVTRRDNIPVNWTELKLRHYPALAKWYFAAATIPANNPVELLKAAAELFCRWMKIDTTWAQTTTVQNEPQVSKIALNFIASNAHPVPLSNRIGFMAGPGAKLINMRYQQFIFAERLYENWVKTGCEKSLAQLATLTHRCLLMPYSMKLAGLRHHIIKRMPQSVLLRAAFTYMGQRAHLPKLYPELYKSREGKSPQLKIDQMILNQSGAELGDFKKVAAAPVHRVLEYMQLKEKEAIKNNPKYARSNATVEDLYAKAGYRKLPDWAK